MQIMYWTFNTFLSTTDVTHYYQFCQNNSNNRLIIQAFIIDYTYSILQSMFFQNNSTNRLKIQSILIHCKFNLLKSIFSG